MTTTTDPRLTRLEQARAALAEEWGRVDPQTPDEIEVFYRNSAHLGADLDAWHAMPTRRHWTKIVVEVAKTIRAQFILDIGAGAGHDLLALRRALPTAYLEGVEPNRRLRAAVVQRRASITMLEDVLDASTEVADLVLLIDVLEHLPDPEDLLLFLTEDVSPGCVLLEATATHDDGTPLHLESNRGWDPGKFLHEHGWRHLHQQGRVRAWQRERSVFGD